MRLVWENQCRPCLTHPGAFYNLIFYLDYCCHGIKQTTKPIPNTCCHHFLNLLLFFLFANASGKGIYDEPLSGSYFAIFKYNFMQLAISKPEAVFVNFSIQVCKYAT